MWIAQRDSLPDTGDMSDIRVCLSAASYWHSQSLLEREPYPGHLFPRGVPSSSAQMVGKAGGELLQDTGVQS